MPASCLRGTYTNSDGARPNGLILSGNTIYGTAVGGGSSDNGTVFAISTDGTGFTTLYSFTSMSGPQLTNSDGANPAAGLVLSQNTLYGTTQYGGNWGKGTLFTISLPVTPPQLTIVTSGGSVILTWPTNLTGFTLQSTTNLSSLVWTTNLPTPVVVNGVNTVTNSISGTRQFFRLAQ